MNLFSLYPLSPDNALPWESKKKAHPEAKICQDLFLQAREQWKHWSWRGWCWKACADGGGVCQWEGIWVPKDPAFWGCSVPAGPAVSGACEWETVRETSSFPLPSPAVFPHTQSLQCKLYPTIRDQNLFQCQLFFIFKEGSCSETNL